MFNRTGFSNLLNKIQFTFEVVPCWILGLFRRFFRSCASIFAQCYKRWAGGRRGRGGWDGEGGGKKTQVNTRGEQLPTDGPDHTIRPKGQSSFRSRVEFQADNAQLVCSIGANVSVIALQGYKTSPQKSRPLEFGHRRYGVWLAIEYSYKLGQKMNLNFSAN